MERENQKLNEIKKMTLYGAKITPRLKNKEPMLDVREYRAYREVSLMANGQRGYVYYVEGIHKPIDQFSMRTKGIYFSEDRDEALMNLMGFWQKRVDNATAELAFCEEMLNQIETALYK